MNRYGISVRVVWFSLLLIITPAIGSQTIGARAQVQQSSQTWLSVFPVGERIFDLVSDAQDPDVLYAATNHGLYKSSDGGMTWLPVMIVASASSLQFAQSTKDPTVMYMAISLERSGKVYKSIDRGGTWTQIGISDLNKPVWVLAVDPLDSNQVFVKDGTTLHKTLNGGKSWGDVTPQLGGGRIDFVSFDPFKDGHVFVGAGYGGGFNSDLLESTDGGLSWTVKDYPAPPAKWKMAFAAPGVSTWESFSIHPNNPKDLIGINNAVGNHVDHIPGLVISEDGGLSWRDITLRKNWIDQRALVPITCLEWSKTSGSKIYVGTQEGTFASSDAGRNWIKLLPYPTTVIRESSPGHLIAATGFGVFKSSDGGHKWHQASLGLPISIGVTDSSSENRSTEVFDAFYKGVETNLFPLETSDGRQVFVAGRGGFWTSEDGGITWAWHSVATELKPSINTSEILPRFSGPSVRQIFTTADKTVFVNMVSAGPFGMGASQVAKIQPDGKIVSIHTSRAPNQIAVSPSDSQAIYMTANEEGQWAGRTYGTLVMKSDDGGFTWQTIDFSKWLPPSMAGSSVSGILALAVSAQSSKTCYALASLNRVGGVALMMTSDGGETWRDIMNDALVQDAIKHPYAGGFLINAPIAVDPKDEKIFYFTFNGNLYRSSSGKLTQLPLAQRTIEGIAVSPINSSTVFIVGDNGISVSRNAGVSWQPVSRGLFPRERAHRVVIQGDQVFAQGDNGIYRLTDGDTDWIKPRWAELEQHPESDPLGYVADFGVSQYSENSTEHVGEPVKSALAKSETSASGPVELTAMWDKALGQRQEVSIPMCREASGFASKCEKGTLTLGRQEVSFMNSKGQKVFVALPSQTKYRRDPNMGGGGVFSLAGGGKYAKLLYVARGVDCPGQQESFPVCPAAGMEQQNIVSDWVKQALVRLGDAQ